VVPCSTLLETSEALKSTQHPVSIIRYTDLSTDKCNQLFLVLHKNNLLFTAYHVPLYQCVAIAFRILVLSVRFIFPQSVVQCYLVHWLNNLSIAFAWPMMMRVQRGFVFNIA